MFNYEKIVYPNVIHCDTEEKANKLLKFMSKTHKWKSGSLLLDEINRWNIHNNKTYYLFSNSSSSVIYGNINNEVVKNYNIISYEDVIDINFKINDKVSMIFWSNDMMVARGKIISIINDKEDIIVQNYERDSEEYLETSRFKSNGNNIGDEYRMLYHGWNVTVDIKGEEIPVRTKWVKCTKQNTNIGDTVRCIEDYWKGKVEYIGMNSDRCVISQDYCDHYYNLKEFEIEVDC